MQYTPHIRLPLFESEDKPTWLYDWNETMMKLDDTLFNMSSADMPPEIASMLARIEALERTVSQHTTDIENLEADVTSILADIANLQSAIDRINALIPSNASTSNQLATMADISGGGQSGHDFNSDDFSIDQNEVSLLDDRRIVELTGAEYDALSQNEKMNGSAYFINDRNPSGGGSGNLRTVTYTGTLTDSSNTTVASDVPMDKLVDIWGVVEYTYQGNQRAIKNINYYQGTNDRIYYGIIDGRLFIEQNLYSSSNIKYTINLVYDDSLS